VRTDGADPFAGPTADRASLLLAAGLLNSDVDVQRRGHDGLDISGSSTERALVTAATHAGLDGTRLRAAHPTCVLHERRPGVHYVVSEHPGFDLIKGAPEQVLALCDREWDAPLELDRLASKGLRVLALAWRKKGEPRFAYLGLVGLRDPVRAGAAEAVAEARKAGIRVILLTGDHRRTAEAVAREVGLDGETIEGGEIPGRIARVAAIARATPADKLAVVEALRARGEVVAMAGDGINDAPALKVAHVGIAVGRDATDLARHVADVVLANDDLRSILAAVAEGRVVQDNLRRAIRFLFATNLSELALMLAAAVAGADEPLTPMQLLWINLLSDTLPALALALEPGERSVLARPPAPPDAPILSRPLERRVLHDGLWLASAGAAGAIAGGPPLAFGVLSGAQLSYTLACRAADHPPDPRFAKLWGSTIGVQALALGFAPLSRLLGLRRPGLALGGFCAGAALPWLAHRWRTPELIRKGDAG
jgi:Ca2+-transporting ATPase